MPVTLPYNSRHVLCPTTKWSFFAIALVHLSTVLRSVNYSNTLEKLAPLEKTASLYF